MAVGSRYPATGRQVVATAITCRPGTRNGAGRMVTPAAETLPMAAEAVVADSALAGVFIFVIFLIGAACGVLIIVVVGRTGKETDLADAEAAGALCPGSWRPGLAA